MIELVLEMFEGQHYYRCEKGKISNRILKENLVYVGDIYCIHPNIYKFDLHKQTHNFYRFVSKEEYDRKVQEKYESTILNIVLKRLINESFVW